MVLSNKKLKQKLRAAKAASLAADGVVSGAGEKSESTELQALLEASKKQLSKVSKRGRKRKSQSVLGLSGSVEGNEEDKGNPNEDVSDGKKKRKKEGVEGNERKAKRGKRLKKKNKTKKIKNGNDVAEAGTIKQKDRNEESQIEEVVATKVYVGGIPYYSTDDDIRSYFEGCGTITDIDCMTFPDSGKFRGIAIVSFKTEAAASRALALDGSDMGGFYLKIKPFKASRFSKPSDFQPEIVANYNRIYVGNLPWEITEDDLKKFLSGCNISSIRFGMDKETGEFKGYAHIDFSDNLSVEKALKLNQSIVCGRPVKVSCAIPKKGARIAPSAVPEISDAKVSEAVVAVSGKIRRRTCLECGQKGHLYADCPNKQKGEST